MQQHYDCGGYKYVLKQMDQPGHNSQSMLNKWKCQTLWHPAGLYVHGWILMGRLTSLCVTDVRASAALLLLQQRRDVDVPADGLSVKATGEQVARLVLFVPRCTTHHAPVALHTQTHRQIFGNDLSFYWCWLSEWSPQVLTSISDTWNQHTTVITFHLCVTQ